MSPDTVKQMIESALPGAEVKMDGQDCNFSVEVTSELFNGKSRLARHRMVNEIFKEQVLPSGLVR
jgi:acid stress-induced BolA-like protein IbaG/YrbA